MSALTAPGYSPIFLPEQQLTQSPKPYDFDESCLADEFRIHKQMPCPYNSLINPQNEVSAPKPESKSKPTTNTPALTIKEYVFHLGYDEEILSHFPLSFLSLAHAQKLKVGAAKKAKKKAQAEIDRLQDTSGEYDHAYTYFHDLAASEDEDLDVVALKTRAFKARGEAEAKIREEQDIWKKEVASRFKWAERFLFQQRVLAEQKRSSILEKIAALSPRGEIPWGKSVTDLFPISKLEIILCAHEKLTAAEAILENSTKVGSIAPLEIERAVRKARREFCDETKEFWVEKVRIENERVAKENEKWLRFQRLLGGQFGEARVEVKREEKEKSGGGFFRRWFAGR